MWGELFGRNIRNFFRADFFCLFLELCKCLLRYKKFSKLGSRKFHFLKYKNIYHFPSSKSSVSWNINNFFVASLSWNIRKAFFWDNIRNFFEISASWYIRTVSFWENIRNILISECKKVSWGGFFCLASFGWKVHQIAAYYTTI